MRHSGENSIIVAVDGPAGSGKSSVCKEVCRQLEWVYCNTGSLYRAFVWGAKETDVDLCDEKALCDFLPLFKENFLWDLDTSELYYKAKNITQDLHTHAISEHASTVARYKKVRKKLLPIQRMVIESYEGSGMLVDGRDIGTVVCPGAALKIYMTASLEKRAERRLKEIKDKFPLADISLTQLMEDIKKRDERDITREAAPLIQSHDALVLDTSELDFNQSVERMILLIKDIANDKVEALSDDFSC